ncbi:MAG: hypothetical protein HON33_06190, partial [Flavobacteriaceae bacterium]|nr:hypothetical protein [Flavobacteriaceae bacterium]
MSGIRARQARINVAYDEQEKEITITINGPGRMTGKQFQTVMARYHAAQVAPIIARSITENFEVSINLILNRVTGIQKIPKLDYFTRMPRDRFCNLVKKISLTNCTDLKNIDRLAVFLNLESLDISQTKIESFPKELCGLGNLKVIKHNVLTNVMAPPKYLLFPDEFTNITSLEVLELKNYKRFIRFNDNFTVLDRATNKGLFNLKKLTLTGSHIADFPQNLDNLETLTDLELVNCRFGTGGAAGYGYYMESIDEPTIVEGVINTIKKIPNLEKLRLSSTAIKSLFRVNDGDFTSLRVLNLNEIGFEEIDLGIFNLTNLTTLTFQGNKLSNIPEEISSLVNLTVLDLGTNQLTSLPDSMGQLVNLKKLYLDDNNLETLPSTFVNLVNVTTLNVKNNNRLTENIENICEDLGEEVPKLEIVPSDSSNTMDIFKLFDRTGCPQRPLVIRSLNSQYNKGTFPRDFFVNFTGPNPARLRGGSQVMTVPLISEDTEPEPRLVNLLIDMGFSENAAKKAALINFNNQQNAIDWLTSPSRSDLDEPLGDFNFLQQTLLLIEDLFVGRNQNIQGRIIPLKMLLIYGFFRVRYVDNPGIDAGGLYRQYITDMSKYFEEENDMVFKRQGSGKIVVNKDTPRVAERLTDIIGILIMIYNTGYGSFTSSFKFGHAITLYQGVFPDKNIFESKTTAGGNLENVVKDFAIKILDEPEE